MCNTTKDICDVMCRNYHDSLKVKRAHVQFLRQEFKVFSIRENETVDEYFARTLAITNPMTTHRVIMEQVLVAGKILRSMTSRFNYIVCSIEESNDVNFFH